MSVLVKLLPEDQWVYFFIVTLRLHLLSSWAEDKLSVILEEVSLKPSWLGLQKLLEEDLILDKSNNVKLTIDDFNSILDAFPSRVSRQTSNEKCCKVSTESLSETLSWLDLFLGSQADALSGLPFLWSVKGLTISLHRAGLWEKLFQEQSREIVRAEWGNQRGGYQFQAFKKTTDVSNIIKHAVDWSLEDTGLLACSKHDRLNSSSTFGN